VRLLAMMGKLLEQLAVTSELLLLETMNAVNEPLHEG